MQQEQKQDVVAMEFRKCFYDVPYKTLLKTGMNPSLLQSRSIQILPYTWENQTYNFCFRDAMTMGYLFLQKRPLHKENVTPDKIEKVMQLVKSLGMQQTAWTDTEENMKMDDFARWYVTLPSESEYLRDQIVRLFNQCDGSLSVNDVYQHVRGNKESLRQVFRDLSQEGRLVKDLVVDPDSQKFVFVEVNDVNLGAQ